LGLSLAPIVAQKLGLSELRSDESVTTIY
jgi:hypothetical protein